MQVATFYADTCPVKACAAKWLKVTDIPQLLIQVDSCHD